MLKLPFFTPVSNQTNIREKYYQLNFCEKFFDLGRRRSVHVVDIKDNEVETAYDSPQKKNLSTYAGYVFKIILIATIILPALAIIGKCIYRKANRFSIKSSGGDSATTGVARKTLKLPQKGLPLPDAVVVNGVMPFLEPKEQVALSLSSKNNSKIFNACQEIRKEATYHNITDEYLEKLCSKAPNLETLHLIDCKKLTDKGLKYLSSLKKLKNLSVKHAKHKQLTNTGLKHLGSLPLQTLDLSDCKWLDEEGLKHLTSLPLHTLDLSDCDKLKSDSLKYIASLPLHTLKLSYCDGLTDESLKYLSSLPLKTLDLSSCDWLIGTGLRYLSSLPLHTLNLRGCEELTDEGLKHLGSLPLQTLDVSCCNKLTDEGLKHLNPLSLQTLHCCNGATSAGLQHFSSSPLKILTLSGSTDLDLQNLACLKKLTSLTLSCGKITDAGLQHFAYLENLKSLRLVCCSNLSGAGFHHLASLPLQDLSLAFSELLTDAGLMNLVVLTRLQSLNLSGCKLLTGTGLQHLAPLPLETLIVTGCYQITYDNLKNNLAFLKQLHTVNIGTLRNFKGPRKVTSLSLHKNQNIRINWF